MYYLKRIVQSIQMREPHRSLEGISVLIDVPLATLKQVMAQGDQFEPVMFVDHHIREQSVRRVHRHEAGVVIDETSAMDAKMLETVQNKQRMLAIREAIEDSGRRSAQIPPELIQKLVDANPVLTKDEFYARMYGKKDEGVTMDFQWDREGLKKVGIPGATGGYVGANPCAEIPLPIPAPIVTRVKLAYILVNKVSPIHQECFDNLRQHIPRYGVLKPVHLIQHGKEYLCVDGKHRLMAAMAAGIEEIPAIVSRSGHSALGIEFTSIHEALNSKVVHVDTEGCDGKIRAMFPTKDGHQLVEMDFKNLELPVGTHFVQVSGDRNAAPVFKDDPGKLLVIVDGKSPCSCPKRQVLDSGCTCGGY